MALSHLHNFISLIETCGDLSRITAAVDPCLEIAAITDRICKWPHGGTALLFEHPAGSHFRVATNLFGSMRRVCKALGVNDLDELHSRFRSLLELIGPTDFSLLEHRIANHAEFSRFTPVPLRIPEAELVRMSVPDLTVLPFLQSWPGDGAANNHPRYITLAQTYTIDPLSQKQNCGLYRIQVRGQRELAIQWKPGSGADRHAQAYRSRREKMPVAIVLGGPAEVIFCSMFPLPGDLDEITFAGFLRRSPVETAPCPELPLQIPTGVELIIEGYVETDAFVTEGPFGNHTGHYAPEAPASLMQVTEIYSRNNAVIPATVVGRPPMEDCWMALAWERLLLALIQQAIPAVCEIHFPFEWVFHQSAIISLENPGPGMVRNVAEQFWALPWFRAARMLVFVNADNFPGGLQGAAWQAINLTDAAADIFHDPISDRTALDATGSGRLADRLVTSPETSDLISRRWREYGLA